ncbi:HAD family hydrolase [Pseudobacteriovorax antillogorgiicola]|uniref:Haloacid dehalogenase superfamily, subfamily IA, variant 3 with third motif having DD or ED n=1 Tax=Pseudobacteriovorax antillogorgiicola TaxID=1513793 RepID=A0A1Y6B4R7_9BACT|nr:HAD family phosphatase [Pseudobacteriovorax antillogorgiicola]TCS59243.1 HAD superfamily hydrolase (TIGR01509 family) [Pseudobacteriovorax antillogorgiicola]SME90133.1 haloacid dehalogenase superfamily, subfamily IA, variant 3 with third motif having DD or ED [Pseudobacteriovorax antillogorgiicola]
MTKNLAAVLFDFDGVVVDSMPAHLQAWKIAYEELFNETLSAEDLDRLVGKSTKVISGILAARMNKGLLSDELAQRKIMALQGLIADVALLPGVRETFQSLHSQKIPFGIVSNASREFIGGLLMAHDLDVPFFLGIEDYTKPKPHPQPYFLGAEKAGFTFSDYKNIMVFEDSVHGLKAALGASMIGVGVTTQHSADVLAGVGAHHTCAHLDEALALGLLPPL